MIRVTYASCTQRRLHSYLGYYRYIYYKLCHKYDNSVACNVYMNARWQAVAAVGWHGAVVGVMRRWRGVGSLAGRSVEKTDLGRKASEEGRF